MSKEYSPNPAGKGESIRLDISGAKPEPHDFRRDLNAAEAADAAVRHYAHPIEHHFAPSTGRGPLGRGISRDLAKQLGIGDE